MVWLGRGLTVGTKSLTVPMADLIDVSCEACESMLGGNQCAAVRLLSLHRPRIVVGEMVILILPDVSCSVSVTMQALFSALTTLHGWLANH